MSPNNNSDPVIDALEKQLRNAEEKLGDQLQNSVDRSQKVLKTEKEKLAKGKEAVKAAKLRLRYAKGNNTQLARAKRSLDNIEAKQALLESSHEEAKQAAALAKRELGRFQAAQKAVAQLDKEAGMSDAKAPAKKTAAKSAAKKAPAKAAAKSAKAVAKKATAKKEAVADNAKKAAPAKKAAAKTAPAKKATAKKAPAKAAAEKAETPAAPAPAPKKAAKPRKPEPDIERTIPPPSQTTTPKGKKDRLRSLFDAID